MTKETTHQRFRQAWIIWNVAKFFKQQPRAAHVVEKTAEACGVSISTVELVLQKGALVPLVDPMSLSVAARHPRSHRSRLMSSRYDSLSVHMF